MATDKKIRPSVLLAVHRDETLTLLFSYGARNIMVFGSDARGEDCYDSDLDLLVEFSGAIT